MKWINRTGERRGTVTAIAYLGNKTYLCRCDCGNEYTMATGNFRHAKHCWQCSTKHGKARSPEYLSWSAMKQRCHNPKNSKYALYGGKGIEVCERWRGSFVAFLEDMGEKPSPKHSIDRIDGKGNYTPENCRWATIDQQNRNLSRNHWVEYQGERMVITDLAAHLHVQVDTLRYQIETGKRPDVVDLK